MEPELKDRNTLYRLIIGQLHHDGHNQLALDLSNSIGMNPSPPPSDTLFRMVSEARLIEDDADEEKKGTDMQMSLNPVVSSIDTLSIDDKSRDYFPILVLPSHLLDLVFSPLSIKDRLAFAGVNIRLNKIESESKYHVKKLYIGEKRCIRAPCPLQSMINRGFKALEFAQPIIFVEGKSYSSDCIRRIAHNASIGLLHFELSGSSEFHREVYNLIKEIDVRRLVLLFRNKDLEKEIMTESFVFDLARSCKEMWIHIDNVPHETIHKIYKTLLDGSTKLRHFDPFISKEKCISFLHLTGITYRDGTFFSNRNIEVYKKEDKHKYKKKWYIFDGSLEMTLEVVIFEDDERGYFDLLHHETLESLEKAKKRKGMERIEIGPE